MRIPEDIFERPQYLNRVIPFMGKSLIKVFTGQRRVGKSYILYQLIQKIQAESPEAPIIYINKEDLDFAFLTNAEKLHQFIKDQKKSGMLNYVFIDEIQDIDNFQIALRSLILDDELDIYCTGSNANLLSGDIAGFLSGRVIEIKVYSLSFLEFLRFHGLENEDSALEKFLKYGGLPYLRHLELTDAVAFEYLKNIYTTILYRDVVNRNSIRNTVFLEKLVLFLASYTGSLFSANKISAFLKSQQVKMAPNQVQAYISYLTNAFLIHQVPRYDLVGKRLFEIGDKYYFENLGIRHGLWGYRPEDLGKIIENAVHNQLLISGYEVKVGVLGDKEVNFICKKNGETLYIQVALSIKEPSTIQREFGNLQLIDDNYPKLVITLDDFEGNTFEGIKQVSLRKFLTGE
ncbi:ATP-binding protein [Algoriphagus sp.]|uniref:ATP-binding protein n=1 Tax=Algoriphagus sp. TaxID=1872435 RepID=UPI00391D5D7B